IMNLVKLDDFFPNYRTEVSPGYDITQFEVIAKGDKQVGSIETLLIDQENNRFRYFVVNLGFWIFGRKVLLPIGLGLIVDSDRRIYVEQLTQEQFKTLPEYHEDLLTDSGYETQLKAFDRQLIASIQASNDAPAFSYEQEPDFYELKDPHLQTYQEQLVKKLQTQP
ncbi:PRC-barrel domain-containing protein, partial [Pseudanabaenaceae cyanobacterium LEGE 13415]|nr:PRC-barrel domain-containing protein [Pseudanabaenaceae cyanobacterium LEGE 13415]